MSTYLQTTKANIRRAQEHGHSPVSGGCGMFRCQKCNLSAYLDTEPDTRWFKPCAPVTFTSATAIRAHALNTEGGNGQRWFSKDTMRWFSTRLQRGAPLKGANGLWYFIISNDPGASVGRSGRRYAVCTYDPATNTVETINAGNLQHATIADARSEIRRLVSPPTNNAPNLTPGHAYCSDDDCFNVVPDNGKDELCIDCELKSKSKRRPTKS